MTVQRLWGGLAPVVMMVAACLSGAGVASAAEGLRVYHVDGHHPVTVSAPGAADCAPISRGDAQDALREINALRAQSGRSGLRLDPALMRAAAAQACDMARSGVMTHAGRTRGPLVRAQMQGYQPSLIAENIAAGPVRAFTAQETVTQWWRSPGHRANILLPSVRDFGIGAAVSADGRTVFWSSVYAISQ